MSTQLKRLELVQTSDTAQGEPYTTSEIIARGTGIDRRKVRDTIQKYQAELQAFGKVASYQATFPGSKTGQKVKVYHLNEPQATFLLTLLKNTPAVVAFKKELVRQFYAMRSLLLERASPVWQEARTVGKEVRRIETDTIKAMVSYAQAQGSRNARRYYVLLSKLADRTVGIEDRDKARTVDLVALLTVERAIARQIGEAIAAGKPYWEIYPNIRDKLAGFGAVAALGGPL